MLLLVLFVVAPIKTPHFVLWLFMCFSCRGKESEGSHDVDVQPVFALAALPHAFMV
jgi:hypothetical protein